MGALNKIIGFFKGLFNLPALQEIKDLIYSGIMFVLYQDSVEGQSLTNIEVIDYVIRFGMLIIVWYGVIKIVLNVVWRILFGKPLLWKVGILEVFFGRLKPVYAQRMADITDAEIEEKTERYFESFSKVTKKITKDDTRRCCKMNVFKNMLAKMNVNKKTNTAIGTLGALAVGAGGYFAEMNGVPVSNVIGVPIEAVVAASALASVGLVLPGVLGAGRQSKEQFEVMLKQKKDAKLAKKKAKAAGVPKQTLGERAVAYAKKNNVSEALALQVIKEQDAKAQAEAALKREAREEKIIASIVKKQNISPEMAKALRADQITRLAK